MLRLLGKADRERVQRYVDRAQAENLFVAAKLHDFGMDFYRLGLAVGDIDHAGELTALVIDGGTLFASGQVADAVGSFADYIGAKRRATSMMGSQHAVLALHAELSRRFGPRWSEVSNVRTEQPLMVLDADPAVESKLNVKRLGCRHYRSYLRASVHMYTSEIGSSPYKYGGGYDAFVRDRLMKGDAWGIVSRGEVIFKADIGPRVPGHAQLQGVWVSPRLRGQGMAVPALASMLRQVRRQYPVISLYVNHFNQPAIRAYERLGFRRIGALATVHY